ncbi:hypothetical protein J5500_02690 [Candidatus Saccharibacteria bacterium]|nr:hypothetical protein [Candidatus Saccharibacteria bacterium]
MNIQKGRVKGFTIIETMLFLALTGLMLVGALIGIGSNLARQRYKDSVQDIVTMIRNQYDYVTRVQIDSRVGNDMCEIVADSASATFTNPGKNLGRGRSMCNIYGVAIIFGLDDGTLDSAGTIVQSTSILGMDINTFEDIQRVAYPMVDPLETIAAMPDQQLLKNLKLNNILERVHKCEAVNVLEYKKLNWGSKVEDVVKDRIKKGIVLIIRSPRDGTVHTFTYDFSDKESIEVLDYRELSKLDTTCNAFTSNSIDINSTLGQDPPVFKNNEDFKLCITSDDVTGTYGKRRMIKIAADGHNSSAVSLVDEASEDDACQQ